MENQQVQPYLEKRAAINRNAKVYEAAKWFVECSNKFLDWAHHRIEIGNEREFFKEYDKAYSEPELLLEST